MSTPKPIPALKVAGQDPRAIMYGNIARFHQGLVEAHHRAKMAGVRPQITNQDIANIAMHCEASMAFLAEELLKLGKLVESGPEIET